MVGDSRTHKLRCELAMRLEFCFIAHCRRNDHVTPHRHDALELVYCLDGSGRSTILPKTYDLRRNSFTITPKGTLHDQVNLTDMVSICVGLSESGFEPLQGGWFDTGGVLGRALCSLAQEIEFRQPGHELVCRGLLLEIGGLVQRISQANVRPPRKKALVGRAIEIIQHSEGGVSVAELAGRLYVSKDYLRHLFQEYTSRSPIQHIIQARIDKARDLLGQGDLDVKEVAARCGFDNEYYFSRLFRKVTGTTPSRYRSGKS
jgi:AraC-like DNA-binding protein